MIASALHVAIAVFVGLGAAFRGTVNVTDRVQTSSRFAPDRRQAPFDFDNSPSAALGLKWSSLQLMIGYTAQLTVLDALNARQRTSVVLHTGFSNATFFGPRYRLSLSQAASVGTQTFARLVTTPANPGVAPDPAASRVDFIPPSYDPVAIVSLTSGAVVEYDWTRRWRTGLSAAYAFSGGTGRSEGVLPQQSTTVALASTDYAVSRQDQIGVSLGVEHLRTSLRLRYSAVRGTVGWTYRAGPGTAARVEGGAVVGVQTSPETSPSGVGFVAWKTAAYPRVAASLGQDLFRRRGIQVALGLGAAAAPMITAVNGQLQQRVQGTATLNTTVADNTIIAATGDAAQTLPLRDAREVRILGVGLAVTHRAATVLDLTLGGRMAWQHARDPLNGSFPALWFAYAGVILRSPGLTF